MLDLCFYISLCFTSLAESSFEQGLMRKHIIYYAFSNPHSRNFQDDLFRTTDKCLNLFWNFWNEAWLLLINMV